jgi:SAM-dependent methyltransferase
MRVKIYGKKQVQQQWNDVWSSDSIQRNMAKLDYPEYWDIFDKFIPKNGRLLEAGCGLGKWINYFYSRNYNITGLDYSDVAVNELQKFNEHFKVQLGDITNIPFENESFDVYLSFGVLEHLEDDNMLAKAISEAHRILTGGGGEGIAIITIPYLNWSNFTYSIKNKIWSILKHGQFFEYNYTIHGFLKYFDLIRDWSVEAIVPENIPLILKRNQKYRIKNPTHIYDTNLNELGMKRWKELLKLPDTSFIRKQNSHLVMYVLRKK